MHTIGRLRRGSKLLSLTPDQTRTLNFHPGVIVMVVLGWTGRASGSSTGTGNDDS